MENSIFDKIYISGLLSFFLSLFITYMLVATKKFHISFTTDYKSGPQKIHSDDIPRIGGLSIFLSFLIMPFFLKGSIDINFIFLIIAITPSFLGGFAEDLTKKINPYYRLLTSLVSGICFVYFFETSISHIDIKFIDFIFENTIFSISLTVFSVILLTQSMNIIDGLNGLSLGCALIACFSIFLVCIEVKDYFLISIVIIMIGCILGCLIFNFPRSYIFIGDGGAYLIGSFLAFLVIFLSERNDSISPFYCLLIVFYPIYETTRSFFRRVLLSKNIGFKPDQRHLHSLLFQLILRKLNNKSANSLSSLLILTFQSLYAVIAFLFFNNQFFLIVFIIIFIMFYELVYFMLRSSVHKG